MGINVGSLLGDCRFSQKVRRFSHKWESSKRTSRPSYIVGRKIVFAAQPQIHGNRRFTFRKADAGSSATAGPKITYSRHRVTAAAGAKSFVEPSPPRNRSWLKGVRTYSPAIIRCAIEKVGR